MSEINFILKVKQPYATDRCFFVGVKEKEPTSLVIDKHVIKRQKALKYETLSQINDQ